VELSLTHFAASADPAGPLWTVALFNRFLLLLPLLHYLVVVEAQQVEAMATLRGHGREKEGQAINSASVVRSWAPECKHMHEHIFGCGHNLASASLDGLIFYT
jgi:hypothetical protein